MARFSFTGIKLTGEGKRYMEEMNKLIEHEVHIGYQSGDGQYEDGAELIDVVAWNEFGTSRMPARPFMKQSFENNPDKLNSICQRATATVNGGGSAMAALNQIGVECKGLIQDEIRDGDFAPNAPSTVRTKDSDHPLIDTGYMRQSVNYVIR